MKGDLIENRIVIWDIKDSQNLFKHGYFGKPIGIPKPKTDEINVPLILDLIEGCYLQEISKINRLESSGQSNMFDLFGEEVSVPLNLNFIEEPIDYKKRMFWERDLLGAVLSENPINKRISLFSKSHIVLTNQLNANKAGQQVKVIGQVLSITERTTRAKATFIICEFGLLDNSIELVVWPDKMEISQDLWETGSYLELNVKTNNRNGSLNLIFETGKKMEFERI